MGIIDQGTAVISQPAQETMTPINDGHCAQTNIHCPRCGVRMSTNYRALTEMDLICQDCGLLAKWYGRNGRDYLAWNMGEVRP
jgi:hypothetical protein